MKKELLHKLREIKLFLFDLEGVLLHNADSLDEKSLIEFAKQIEMAAEKFDNHKFTMGIVTARKRDRLINELDKIDKCTVLTTSVEKVEAVEKLAAKRKIDFSNIFYMGDEVLDIPLLKKCGLSAAPKSAIRDVKRVVDFTMDGKSVNSLFNELFLLIDKAN